MTLNGLRSRWREAGAVFLFAAVFAASRRIVPPREWRGAASYWLHALALGGYGNLGHDWQGKTTSLEPGFDHLLAAVLRVGEAGTYVVWFGLIAIYVYALLDLAMPKREQVTGVYRWALFGLILFAHWQPWWDRLHVDGYPIPGAAGHFLISPVLGPQIFGVLLVLSIALFVRARHYAATIVACAAALVHPTYLFAAGCLTAAYVVTIVVRTRDWRRAAICAGLALVIVAPMVLYAQHDLGASSPAVFQIGQDIISKFRIPQHTDPAAWFHWHTLAMIAVVAIAIALERRTDLGLVLAIVLALTLICSALVVVLGRPAFATIMPWRVSVILVPIAFVVILGHGWAWTYRRIGPRLEAHRMITTAAIALLAVIPVRDGTTATAEAFGRGHFSAGLFGYAREHTNSVYVIPEVDLYSFRVQTGAPIFVDAQTHPFRDREVIEWFSRLLLVERLYGDAARDTPADPHDTEASPDPDCAVLARLPGCGVTHVVDVEDTLLAACRHTPGRVVYSDLRYTVYELPGPSGSCVIADELARFNLAVAGNYRARHIRFFGE